MHPTICAMFFKHGRSLMLDASFGPTMQSGVDKVWNSESSELLSMFLQNCFSLVQ